MKNFLLVLSICSIGSIVFPANSQAQWIPTNGPYTRTISSFVSSGTYLFAGTEDDGVYRSTNNGASWSPVNTDLTTKSVTSLAVAGPYLFAGTVGGGVFRSIDNGNSWKTFNLGLSNMSVYALSIVGGTNIFAGTNAEVFYNSQIYSSSIDSASWTQIFLGGGSLSTIRSIVTNGAFIFVSTNNIVYRSSDGGMTWSAANSGITIASGIPTLAVNGTAVFAGGPGGVFRSTDNGVSWTFVINGLYGPSPWVQTLAVSGGNLFAGTRNQGVYVSIDNGDHWSGVAGDVNLVDVRALATAGTDMFAGSGGFASLNYERFGSGIFRSTDNGANWTASSYGLITTTVTSLIYTGKFIAGTANNGIFVSENQGSIWIPKSGNYLDKHILSLISNGVDYFAGTQNGVFHATAIYYNGDMFFNWADASTGLTDKYVKALTSIGSITFAGTASGVFATTDNGTLWTAANAGLTNTNVQVLAFSGNSLFAGTSGGMFYSADSGANWNAVNSGLGNLNVLALTFSGTNLFAGTAGGVFLSTDNGANWTGVNSGLTNTDVRSFTVKGANIFAGTLGGVFQSTNNGTNWNAISTGLANDTVLALAYSSYNLIAGTSGAAAWRRPLSEIISSVEESNLDIPEKYSLGQNYPNPFNPTTEIRFTITDSRFTTLKVYDLLGREVASLINEMKQPGTYIIQWDASASGGLSSGVYFYRLCAGSFTETKKLLLLR